jgi:hypothetical protein
MNAGATAGTRTSLTNTEVPSAFTPVTTRLMDMDASLSNDRCARRMVPPFGR